MPRLRARHLPHSVDITRLTGAGPEGETWSTVTDRPAYVEQKSRLVVDRRSTSPTVGQEITSTTFVVLLIEDDALPGSLVAAWKGTPRERTSAVVDSAYFDYKPNTPNHVELYLE